MAEKHEFQSEAKQVLELMVNSIYSNPDIFVRELISNASDAIDKLRIAGLSDTELSGLSDKGEIRITIDKDSKTLTIADNGIGMSKDELVSYLGTIAHSGTKDFAKTIKEAAGSNLIGQFGVGFYSSFIAADKVSVTSRKAGSNESWTWESDGKGEFTVTEGQRDTNGTTITMHMKEEAPVDESGDERDYLDKWTMRGIIKEYSDFVVYPIYVKEASKPKDNSEKDKEEKDKEEVKEGPVNSMKAIWTRPESEVKEDEYNDFYRHISHDWNDPLKRISYKAEGTSEFKALLYIPSRPPMDLYFPNGKHGIELYIRRVFIMNDCKELIPEYLRFVKGVVDSEDLPLNVSREILQQDRQTAIIKKSLIRKVLETLKEMKNKDSEKFSTFWKNFGAVLKEGIISDHKNSEEILKLCLFDTDKGEKISIDDYVKNMPVDRKKIYYITGSAAETLKDSPKLETFKKKDIPVLILSDPVDEVWPAAIREFDKNEFVSVSSDNADLSDTVSIEEAEAQDEIEKTGLVGKLKDILKGSVEDVRLSTRLVDSPVCFVQHGEPISPQMRNLMKSMGQPVPDEKRIMEINPSHALIKKIAKESEEGKDVKDWASVLCGLASIADGQPVPDGQKFTKLISQLLEK